MQRIVWAGVFAATLVGFLSPSVSAADPINVNPDADAKFLNRMTIEMGGVYFYNSNTTSDGRDGWIYTSVNATCPSTISIDTDTLLPYTLSYAVKTGETCSTASTKGIGIADWEARQWTVFGMYAGNVLSTKADVKTPFKKSTVSGLSVDTYIQDIPASSCPSIVINRGGGNWEFIPVIASGPGEADSNLKAVLGSTAICRVANGGVNDPTSPSRIFNYYGLPATYGDSRYKNDFKLMNSSTTNTTTFQLEGGVVGGVGIAGAGPLATLAATISVATGATADTETCNISGVGWIVCPVSSFIGMITDGVYAAVEQLLYFQIAPDPWDTNPALNPAYTIWSNIRNIANITFVIAFFIVIFSQATSFGISAYGIRKMLPRIIFAAIMVNLSYYICVLGVDISNIVGAGADGVLKGALNSVGATNQTGLGLSPLIASALLAGGAVWGGAVAVGALAGTLGPAMLGMAITFGIAALMAILVALVVLLGRQALLIILIILSPLAFVAYILPNTESLFTKWRKAFTTMLVFYPLVTVLFAGSQVAAAVMRLASDNAFIDILSIGVQAFPLFATPFLLKFSGGVLGRVAGMVNNPSKGPFDRLRKRGEARTERARNNGQARALANFQGRSKRNPGRAAWWQRGGGGAAARTAESEWQDNQAKSNLQSKRQGYIGNTLSNIGSGLAQQGAGGRHATEEDIAKVVAAGMEAVSELEAKNLKAGKVVISQLDLNENQKAELANTGRTTDRDGREVRGELYRAAQISSYAEEGQIGRLDTALQSLGTASDSTKRYTIDALGKSYSTLKQKGHYLNDEEIKETIRSGGTVTRNILIDAAGRASPDLSPQLLSTQDQQAMERTVEAYHTSMSLEGKAKVRAAAKAVKKNGNLQANLVQGDGRSRDIIENYLI